MDTQLNGLVHRKRYLGEATRAILLLLVSVHPAFSATKPDGTIEITNRKEQFMSTLASMPYTSSGAGPILYVLECSTCPSSQAFERDWKGQLDGVKIRRLLIATNTTTANETAYLARTSDINDFYAFMNHTKVAPKIKACNCPQDNIAIHAFNSVVGPLGKVLTPTMEQNGWRKNASPPQFIWQIDGRVFVSRYSKGSFHQILTMLRSGGEPTQASPVAGNKAPSAGAPPQAKISTQAVMAQNSPGQGEIAQTSNAESKSQKSGGASGPDIVGLRIGMSPDEVRAIYKSRGFATASCNVNASGAVCSSRSSKRPIDAYVESFGTLEFTLPGERTQTIPNTKYVTSIHGFIRNLEKGPRNETFDENHALDAVFGPDPGQESLVSLHRLEGILPDKRPTFDVFTKALSEKYGRPSYSPTRYCLSL